MFVTITVMQNADCSACSENIMVILDEFYTVGSEEVKK